MEACDEVCVDIPCERMQALFETVADEHSLIVRDAPDIVEAVACLFAEEPVPKAPDKCTQLWYDDGNIAMDETVAYMFADKPVPKAPDKTVCFLWSDVTLIEHDPAAAGVLSSGLFWWELSVPSLTKRVPPDKNLVYERDGFVARSSHWSWIVGFAVQVRRSTQV